MWAIVPSVPLSGAPLGHYPESEISIVTNAASDRRKKWGITPAWGGIGKLDTH